MLNRSVLYYNRGSKCCLRLIVSLYTLRRVYMGNVMIVLEGEQPEWFIKILKTYFKDVLLKYVKDSGSANTLNVKSSLWRHSGWDFTMFMDSDTVVLRPIDEYFELIKREGFVTGKFADWKTTGSKISSRIKQWGVVLPQYYLKDAIDYGEAINTGINGWVKDSPFLKKWEKMCSLGAPHKCSDRVADEVACQLLLHCNPHTVAGVEWGTSVKYGKETLDTKIIHYHGQKHVEDLPMCKHWKRAYQDLIDLGILEAGKKYDDRRLMTWLSRDKQEFIPRYPITNVTAVNKPYLHKFVSNFPKWMELDYFKEHPMIIFINQDCRQDPIWEIIKHIKPDIKLITVDTDNSPLPGDTVREKMLSVFVFQTSLYVKTKFWTKIDCDCAPTGKEIQLDSNVFKSCLTGHKWHYTKVKSDPTYEKTKEHWLHKLDRVCNNIPDFKGTEPLFKNIPADGLRIGHSRVCTFFAIEKTSWTKHLAKICNEHNDGKMLIPSQDTLSWYCVTRLGKGRNVNYKNMKEYFSP